MSKQQENVEQMRDRLDVNSMDKDDRKKLFKKFQEAGGDVVASKTPQPMDNSSSVKIFDHDVRPNKEENPFRQNVMPIIDNKPIESQEQKTEKVKKVSFMGLFLVRFACFAANIFNFGATRFSKKFTVMCTKTASQELSTLKSFLNVLFSSPNNKEIEKFKVHLAQNKILLELEYVYHAYHLIHTDTFQQLNQFMARSVDESESVFCGILRELKFFNIYQKRMQTSIYIIAKQYEEFFHKKIYNYYDEKKVAQIFSFIWVEWFVWIEQLVTYYWTRYNYKTSGISLNDFLNKGQETPMEIGLLAKKWEKQYARKEIKTQEETQKTESVFPNENIEKGVLFIKNYVDFKQYYKDFQETKDLRALMPVTDKIFYTFVLVDFFDREFSLAWNDINFYVVPDAGSGRFDPKKEIRALHMQLMQFDELVNEFLRTIRSTKNSPSKVDEVKEREISRSSFTARKMLMPILEEYRALFSRIMSFKGKEQDCIGNWDEIVLSSKNQETKALHGYNAEHVISFAYAYIDAMVWLLKRSDLSGLEGEITYMEILPDLSQELKTNNT